MNLIPVTLGNIVVGALLVASVHHPIYNRALRGRDATARATRTEEPRVP